MKIAEKKQLFTATLFRWHRTHYRDMPWRPKSRGRDRASLDPYRILVSEIMLQQTQVDRVRTKYAEFLKQFPDVHALAHASLGDVLRVWSGLGYNRRARYLHECAREVVREHGGKFPDTFAELIKLPGIGRSTAGALLAFSFAQDTPMIDTNIRRILTRTFFTKNLSRFHLDKFPTDKMLYVFAMSLIAEGKGKWRGRAWNYAMLDLGATLCTARNHSDDCPLVQLHGTVGDFVYKKPQKKFKDSNRFYRGKIMRLLMEHHALTIPTLAKHLGKTNEEVRILTTGLARERLVVIARSKIKLPQ